MRFFAGFRMTVWIFTSSLTVHGGYFKIFASLLILVIMKTLLQWNYSFKKEILRTAAELQIRGNKNGYSLLSFSMTKSSIKKQ
jgi:hypothetical protein